MVRSIAPELSLSGRKIRLDLSMRSNFGDSNATTSFSELSNPKKNTKSSYPGICNQTDGHSSEILFVSNEEKRGYSGGLV